MHTAVITEEADRGIVMAGIAMNPEDMMIDTEAITGEDIQVIMKTNIKEVSQREWKSMLSQVIVKWEFPYYFCIVYPENYARFALLHRWAVSGQQQVNWWSYSWTLLLVGQFLSMLNKPHDCKQLQLKYLNVCWRPSTAQCSHSLKLL